MIARFASTAFASGLMFLGSLSAPASAVAEEALLISGSGPFDGQASVNRDTLLGTFVTAEARVLFTEQFGSFGQVFREWGSAREDKSLYAGPTGLEAFFLDVSRPGVRITSGRQLQLGVWHHVVWEVSNRIERLFLNGQIVAERDAVGSGNVRDDSRYRPRIGGAGFRGYIDWIRVSNAGLYGGDPFAPPTGRAALASGTDLLFNFDQVNETVLPDEAGGGSIATLGDFSQVVNAPQAPTMGDLSGDGLLSVSDYTALLLGITDPAAFELSYPSADLGIVGDVNGSGGVDHDDAVVMGEWFGLPDPADYNRDGVVDAADYTVWRDSKDGPLAADGNADGVIDTRDYDVWRLSYGKSYVQDTPAVPEPGGLILLGLVMIASSGHRSVNQLSILPKRVS